MFVWSQTCRSEKLHRILHLSDLVWGGIWWYGSKVAFCVRLQGIRDSLATADAIYWVGTVWRNICQYIFPTLCNKNSKFTIYNIDIRDDVSLCMRICKHDKNDERGRKCEITKKNEKIFKLLWDNAMFYSYFFFKKSLLGFLLVNNEFKP